MRIRHALELKGYNLADVGRVHGCSRGTVFHALRRPDEYPAVIQTVIKLLGRDPFKRASRRRTDSGE